jgi:hypothetical protein
MSTDVITTLSETTVTNTETGSERYPQSIAKISNSKERKLKT